MHTHITSHTAQVFVLLPRKRTHLRPRVKAQLLSIFSGIVSKGSSIRPWQFFEKVYIANILLIIYLESVSIGKHFG